MLGEREVRVILYNYISKAKTCNTYNDMKNYNEIVKLLQHILKEE